MITSVPLTTPAGAAPPQAQPPQTLEEILRKRKLAEALMNEGTSYAPVGHWTQALARVANAAVGGMNAEAARRDQQGMNQSAAEALLGLYQGGQNAMPGTGSVASTPPAAPAAPAPASPLPGPTAATPGLLADDVTGPRMAGLSGMAQNLLPQPAQPPPGRMMLGGVPVEDGLAKGSPDRNLTGMNQTFRADLERMLAEMPPELRSQIEINEANRSPAYQAKLYARYKAGQGGLAAPPGMSFHNSGRAVDFSPVGGYGSKYDQAKYNAALQWMYENGGRYGIENPVRIRGRDPHHFQSMNSAPVPMQERGLTSYAGVPQQQPTQVADSSGQFVDRATLKRLLENPQTQEIGQKLLMLDMQRRQPLSATDQAELDLKRAQIDALKAKSAGGGDNRRQTLLDNGIDPNSAEGKAFILNGKLPAAGYTTMAQNKLKLGASDKIAAGLNNLNQMTNQYDDASFENSVGPFQGSTPDGLLSSLPINAARLGGELANWWEGGKSAPSEVRSNIQGSTEAIAAAIKPLIRAPGEGVWTDADQARLVAVVGDLSQAGSKEEFKRRLNAVRDRLKANFNLDIPFDAFGEPPAAKQGFKYLGTQ